ncbi:long-chain acyl-CoA synthetase [Nocardioides sp. YR527]|uniref:AMP-dependent synthetase/ligase n=1 Tax=Nocardioides sp. YR527 TaxID=1881028 RepID=UPI000889A9E4|nr:long-chain fatty acid--CoA ligase [Nocardioides sp. YR527]SDJ70462.1 long-chain acyl-CoA synthetase [Nocardioides sp. YR527]
MTDLAHTITDIAARVANHGDRVAIRSKRHGSWVERTYHQLDAEITRLAGGLISRGVEPGDRVCILSETRPEWTLVDFALLRIGAVVVPIYPTSSPQDCAWVIGDSGARMIVCEDASQVAKVASVRDRLPDLRSIVVIDAPEHDDDLTTPADLLADLQADGEDHTEELERRRTSVRPEDTWSIVYTSGTTGPPKGCVISHGNMIALCRSTRALGLIREDDLAYLFLPLAHMFARIIQMLSADVGSTVTYYGGDLSRVVEELAEVRPTILPSVPRIFEKIYVRVTTGASDAGGARARIFDWAMGVARRTARLSEQGRTPRGPLAVQAAIADRLVFRKVRGVLGGRVRYCLTGAAPISAEILEFFYGMGIPVVEGYGMTESGAAISTTPLGRPRFGTVGKPLPGVEVRIAEDGEVCARGDNVFLGYYGNPKATAQTVVDGWLHTGDLGELDADGYLSITGRKKDIIITAGGKNLSPANIENDLKRSRWISQAVMHGDRRPYPVALITLDPDEITAYAAAHGLPTSLAELATHPQVLELVQKDLDEANAKQARVGQIKRFAILSEDLSVENGELTPTLKVKRKVVNERHAAVLESLYSSPGSPYGSSSASSSAS